MYTYICMYIHQKDTDSKRNTRIALKPWHTHFLSFSPSLLSLFFSLAFPLLCLCGLCVCLCLCVCVCVCVCVYVCVCVCVCVYMYGMYISAHTPQFKWRQHSSAIWGAILVVRCSGKDPRQNSLVLFPKEGYFLKRGMLKTQCPTAIHLGPN